MLSQIIPFRLTFVLILYTRFLLESHAVSTICKTCSCNGFPMRVNCQNRGLISVPQMIPLNVISFDLRHNDNMACGCHLPAFVDYKKQEYSRYMNVYGSCLNDQNRLTDILQYSQCENYKLFQ
ncbi:uncharacterized protein LOC118768034 [Octopus sinensis]|uniref:Uncharacterized protein LOC118768034 n=1 Tax=Octopus sinensis TaxID=2607531 RepID=A0A7E6FS20_9MOLL|nr:uncharacterized protein LOC118768034 [Octopus sinensis]